MHAMSPRRCYSPLCVNVPADSSRRRQPLDPIDIASQLDADLGSAEARFRAVANRTLSLTQVIAIAERLKAGPH